MAGWRGFAAWAVVGALLALSLWGAASIGLFVFPLAVLGVVLVRRRARPWPEAAGMLEGVAALSLFVGTANLGSSPCPAAGSGTVNLGAGAGGGSACGGMEPLPWLLVGLALAATGLFVGARRRT